MLNIFLLIFCNFIAVTPTRGKNGKPMQHWYYDWGQTSRLVGRDPTRRYEVGNASNIGGAF